MLSPREMVIYLFAKELGIDFDCFENSFNERLKFQKLMYLLFQFEKVSYLSTRNGLYLHGPYSSELADIGYNISNELDNLEGHTLNNKGKTFIKEAIKELPSSVQEYISSTCTDDSGDLKKLEAIATLVMLCDNLSFLDDENEKKNEVLTRYQHLKGEIDNIDGLYAEALQFYNSMQ